MQQSGETILEQQMADHGLVDASACAGLPLACCTLVLSL
jgi:hypothetical protein